MRAALPVAALFLTAGIALAATPTASACGGLVDVNCNSTYCDDYTPDGCFHYEDVYCIVYVDPTRAWGGDENQATIICYLLDPTV